MQPAIKRLKVARSIHEVRRDNLRELISRAESKAAFALAIGRDMSFVARRAGPNPSSNIGEKLARTIETTLGLPDFWLDEDRTGPLAIPSLISDNVFSSSVTAIPLLNENLPPAELDQLLSGRGKPDGVATVDAVLKRKSDYIAYRLPDDALIRNRQPIPPGAIVIADTKREAKPGDYVIAIEGRKSETIQVRELKSAGGAQYLHSEIYGTKEFSARTRILGVVTKVQLDLFGE